MKVLFVDSPGQLSLRDVEKPRPKDGEVLVKMHASGVCGTDIEKVRGHGITSKVLGHEVVGEIAGLGEKVSGLSIGDRVFTHHHTACLACGLCRRGEFTLCPEYGRSNILPGGFSEYYIVPEWNVRRGAILKLPDSLDYKSGSLIEPLACCIRSLSKVDPRSVSRALIYGAGPVGLLHLKLLLNLGVSDVGLVDISGYRLEFGRREGASRTFDASNAEDRRVLLEAADRPDLVIVATGNAAAFEDALLTGAKGGKILLFGAPTKGASVELDLASLFLRGLTLTSSYAATEKETMAAKEMLSNGTIAVSDMVTHVFSLADSIRAFEVAQQQQCMKAVVVD